VDLSQKPGESNVDFHRRLVYGKLVDKTLSDVDYSELANALYGKEYASDVARRMVYGSRYTLDALTSDIESGIQDKDILATLEEKRLDLQKERQRFYDQRREYSKLVTNTGRVEHLEDRLVKAAEELKNTIGTVEFENYVPFPTVHGNEAILVLCDWHYGMTADNAFNTYNTAVCRERVQKVVNSTIERIRLHQCDTLHIVVLGDLVHGAIHTSARVAAEELVCEQLMNVSEILAQAIEHMSGYVSETKVYMTYGNHGRTVQKKDDNIHRDNMERIIPWWLRQRLSDTENVEVVTEFENEFMVFNVCGCGFCASHGDLDSVKSSPRLLTVLFQKKYGVNIDYILLADKHHRESFEELGVSAVICGALCGSDEYANNKRLYSTPEQLLLIAKDGVGVDAEYHIRCDK